MIRAIIPVTVIVVWPVMVWPVVIGAIVIGAHIIGPTVTIIRPFIGGGVKVIFIEPHAFIGMSLLVKVFQRHHVQVDIRVSIPAPCATALLSILRICSLKRLRAIRVIS
jgi:hypothetical protein